MRLSRLLIDDAAASRLLLILAFFLSSPGSLAAQDSAISGETHARAAAAPAIQAVRATELPVIDGQLDDDAWNMAPLASDFVQFRPDPGQPASERTAVRVLYTDDAVYIGARMYDRDPGGIIRRLARRDEEVTTDAFHVAFDSYFDHRTAFRFSVSVAGVQSDWLMFSDTGEDAEWDAVWESATRTDEEGWSAELRIPLSQLRFARSDVNGAGSTWGINFWREIARLEESSVWSPLPEDGSRVVSAFGTLRDLEGIRPRRNLEVRPYVLSSATREPGTAADPFYTATALHQTVGGDLKYGITDNLTLNVTVNPDFGQVEADPSVVNLTAFETFFPEKRPFFQEGSDIFEFSIGPPSDDNNESLFYSRRVGRSPQGSVTSPVEYRDAPDATNILGAAKLSGKTADGWSIGFLDALTGSETTRFSSPAGALGEQLVEPVTNYAMGRIIKDFRDGESAIGLIATATHRRVEDGGGVDFLADAAYTGGVDFRHRFAGGNYEIDGHVLGSTVLGSAEAIERIQRSSVRYFQRPDANHLEFDPTRRRLMGMTALLSVGKVGGGNWQYGLFGETRSPGFEANDLGFQQNADQHTGAAWLSYQQFRPQGPFRSWGLNSAAWSGWNYGGERLFLGGNVNGHFQLKNFWRGFFGLGQDRASLATTSLRGGPALYAPNHWSSWAGMFTDSRQAVQFGAVFNFGGEYGTGTGRWGFSPHVTIQPSSRFQLNLGPSFNRNDRAWQYVAQPRSSAGAHYVFARLSQQTVSLTSRLNYTFSPDLSLQFYAQPFVSAGTYDRWMEVDDPRASSFGDRFRVYGDREVRRLDANGFGLYQVDDDSDGAPDFSFGDPDFTIKSFRSNLVLRWQYRPGSTVFLVWSRDQQSFVNDGSFRFGRDVGDIARIPSTNIFLIKFEHWLGL
ncbi:DUF5916 domain-containing protein [Candidatus Palauibacter sp.]|uniref:DUF5916 domain-containing protein n=1 Tax=Candidatus Palauibacter sp. TaxID=3101350 RepID=UPI003AF237FD